MPPASASEACGETGDVGGGECEDSGGFEPAGGFFDDLDGMWEMFEGVPETNDVAAFLEIGDLEEISAEGVQAEVSLRVVDGVGSDIDAFDMPVLAGQFEEESVGGADFE